MKQLSLAEFNISEMSKGASVIITNLSQKMFIVQRRGEESREPFRGKLSFFGGSLEKYEHAHSTIRRELIEEIREDLALKIIERISYWKSFCVYSDLYNKDYGVCIFVSILDEKDFDEVALYIVDPNNVYEYTAEVFTKEGILVAIEDS